METTERDPTEHAVSLDAPDPTRYYILVGRDPVAVSEAGYDAAMDQDAEARTIAEDWLRLADGLPLDDAQSCREEAVVCVTTYFHGIGDDYRFYTELWSDAEDCCEQERLAGYTRWDDALAGHDLVVRLVQAQRLSPCTCCCEHHFEPPTLGVLGR